MPSYPTRKHRGKNKGPSYRPVRRDIRTPTPANDNPRFRTPTPANDNPRRPRYFPLQRAARSGTRFIPGLGVALTGIGLLEAYSRRRVPFPPPILPTNQTWYIRHGPNTYGPPYVGPPSIQARQAYLGKDGYGPETGKIGGQAIQASSRYPLGSVVPSNWGAVGIWIPNSDGSRYAQYMHIRANNSGEWPSEQHIRAENINPHPEWLWPGLDVPGRFVLPSPHSIPPGMPLPQPRQHPSPEFASPPMPAPLGRLVVEPARGPGSAPFVPGSSVPSQNIEFEEGGGGGGGGGDGGNGDDDGPQRPGGRVPRNRPPRPARLNRIRHNRKPHRLRRPRRKTKEKKGRMARVAFKIGDIVGKFTEFLDVVDAAYDAIPGKAFNPKDRVFYRGRDVTGMKQKMELVYRHADDIQLDQFVKNLLWQHVQDEALGRFMGQAEKGLGKNRLRGVSRLSRLGTVAG